jgi:hypothetical protein
MAKMLLTSRSALSHHLHSGDSMASVRYRLEASFWKRYFGVQRQAGCMERDIEPCHNAGILKKSVMMVVCII